MGKPVMCHLAASLVLVACSIDTRVRSQAVIQCGRASDCPTGFTCRESIRRCVPSSIDDVSGPSFTVISLSPSHATVATELELHVAVDEPLNEPPEVTLGVDGPPWQQQPDANGELVFTTTMTQATPSGEVDIDIHARDRLGNATSVTLGRVVVDFAAPAIDGVRWLLPAGKSRAKPDDTLSYEATVEAGATLLEATLLRSTSGPVDVSADLLLQVEPDGTQYLAGIIDLAAVAVVDGESLTLQLRFGDLAGNENPPGSVQTVPLLVDSVAPHDLAASYDGPVPSQSRDVVLNITGAGATMYRVSGDLVSSSEWQPAAFPVQVPITLSEGDGNKNISVELRDEAFHQSPAVVVPIAYSAGFDTEGPHVLSVNAESATLVRINFDEPVQGAAATLTSNYSLILTPGGSNDPQVLTIGLAPNGQSVTLVLDRELVGAAAYEVTLQNQRDLLGQLQAPNPATLPFAGFGSAPDPAAPDILAPLATDAVLAASPTLVWTARTGAHSYTIEVADNPGFSPLLHSAVVNAPATNYALPIALSDTTYYWRVRSDIAPQTFAASAIERLATNVYVSCLSAETCDDDDGTRYGNRSKPFRTLARALTVASNLNLSSIRIAGGGSEYVEVVTAVSGIELRGGYSSAFAFTGVDTVIRAPTGAPAALVAIGIDTSTAIHDLHFIGATTFDATAVTISSSTQQLVLSDSTLEVPAASHAYSFSAALHISSSGTTSGSGPTIRHNTIRGGARDEQSGGDSHTFGVLVESSAPVLTRNTIYGGNTDKETYAVSLRYSGEALLTNNLLLGGSELAMGGTCGGLELLGSYSPGMPAVIINNTIVTGACDSAFGGKEWAVAYRYSASTLINNLLVTRSNGSNSHCVHRTLNMVTDLVRVEKSGLVTCSCGFHDGTSCQADPQAAGAVTTWVHNDAGASTLFTNAAGDDFHLLAGAPAWARRYGRDTRSGTCDGVTCGNVTIDGDAVTRTCSVAPPASGAIPVSTNCLSRGAFEL